MTTGTSPRGAGVVAAGLLALFGVSFLTTSGVVGVDIPILTGDGSVKLQFLLLLGVSLAVAAGLMGASTTPTDG